MASTGGLSANHVHMFLSHSGLRIGVVPPVTCHSSRLLTGWPDPRCFSNLNSAVKYAAKLALKGTVAFKAKPHTQSQGYRMLGAIINAQWRGWDVCFHDAANVSAATSINSAQLIFDLGFVE